MLGVGVRERLMKSRDRVALVIAVWITIAVVLAVAWRLRRGIDFTDEAFYLALPVRFALGDRPFVDELNIAQSAALLIYPFVKLHVLVRGTTGIFAFVRVLYVLFFACVGWTVYDLARTRLARHTALLTAAPALVFVPYAIPGLSYNTLSTGLLTIGLMLITRALLLLPEQPGPIHTDRLAWGGFALAAATFAYPSLVVTAVVATGSVLVLASGRRFHSLVRVVVGAAAFVVVVSPVFIMAGPKHLQEVLAYSGGGMALSLRKLETVWDRFVLDHPELPKVVVAAAVVVVLARRWPRVILLLVPAFPVLARGSNVPGPVVTLHYVASFALASPLFALALRDSRAAWTIIVGIIAPSMCAGAVAAWTSSNGPVAAGLGLFPAALASGVLLAMWAAELARPIQFRPLRALVDFTPVVLLCTMTKLTLQEDAVYRDAPLTQLTAVVRDGPYKGLLTTPDRVQFLERITADILEHRASARTLFYYDFPAGYLIAARRPLVPSAWIFAFEPRLTMDTQMFEARATSGDFVFKFGPMNTANALDRAVRARAEPLGGHDGYTYWRVR